jgi:hypothetical protein
MAAVGLRGKIYQSMMCFVRPPISIAIHARNATTRLAQSVQSAATKFRTFDHAWKGSGNKFPRMKAVRPLCFVESNQRGKTEMWVEGAVIHTYMFEIIFLVLLECAAS